MKANDVKWFSISTLLMDKVSKRTWLATVDSDS